MPSPRIACLLVPDLPLRAELRAHPELQGEPLVIVSGPDPRADVIAVSPSARREGIHRGASLAQARSICPTLRARVASPALERAARDTLLDIALSLSPRAALEPRSAGFFASEGCVFLDANGVGSLFHSETGFASALAERARRQGLPGVVSLASARTVALLVARSLAPQPDALCVLDPARERAFLDPLPLDLLDPDDRVAQALTRFGVRTVRDLLRLPRRALAQRLGPEILELIDRARGTAPESPLPEPAITRLEEAMDLEAPIDCLEPLGFVMRGLISRLTERLALRGLSCGALELGLRTENGGRDVRRVGLSAPTLDPRVLLRLVGLALERQPPAAPVESVSLQTEGVPTRTDQLDLFAPRGPDPAALDRTLSELEMLCGEGRVGAPRCPTPITPPPLHSGPSRPRPRFPRANATDRIPETLQADPPCPTTRDFPRRAPPCARSVLPCVRKCASTADCPSACAARSARAT